MMQIIFVYLEETLYTWAGDDGLLNMVRESNEIIINERRYKLMQSELDFDKNEYRITLEYIGLKFY
jgi:hypothetical protein